MTMMMTSRRIPLHSIGTAGTPLPRVAVRPLAPQFRFASSSSSSSTSPPTSSSSSPSSSSSSASPTPPSSSSPRSGSQPDPKDSKESSFAFLEQLQRAFRDRKAGNGNSSSTLHLTPALRQKLTDASQRWNVLSGYDEVLRKTLLVDEAEAQLKEIRTRQKEVRQAYVDAVARRSASQRRINDLLQRKSAWTDEDLSAYTALLRAEHGEGRAESEAQAAYDGVEREVGRSWDAVQRTTLERYHAEQVWRDRVREASTYGSIVVAVVNVVVFVAAILFVEPLKRKRLARTFEERLVKVEEDHTALVQGLVQDLASDMGTKVQGIDERLSVLLQRAGVALPNNEDGSRAGASPDESSSATTQPLPPSTSTPTTSPSSSPPPPPERSQTHRKDMALAGGLGFALGAGILAAMGAVWS